jgi:hypothetical protein
MEPMDTDDWLKSI